ncbi:hypothetical protein GDO86_013034, partial [Hymenochirus boettgeri]
PYWTRALLSLISLCFCLNVTVYPHPLVQHSVGENTSLWCSVSHRRRGDSLLTARWVFSPEYGHEQTIGRITKFGAIHISGNWSERGELRESPSGEGYWLLLTDLRSSDQGHYTCRVQEVARYRNRWTAVSNGTGGTKLRVTSLTISEEKNLFTWNLFQDLYLYAALLCCLGILSLLTFFFILLCQTIFHKRRTKVRWKCPNQSPEDGKPSVTNLLSTLPSQGKKRKKKHEMEKPPAIPVKGPLVRMTKNTQRPLLLPRLVEEGLAYAELELMKSSPPIKEPTSSTVYAQILFEESSVHHKSHSEGQRPAIGTATQSSIQGARIQTSSLIKDVPI